MRTFFCNKSALNFVMRLLGRLNFCSQSQNLGRSCCEVGAKLLREFFSSACGDAFSRQFQGALLFPTNAKLLFLREF
jgi:hypothetical protein